MAYSATQQQIIQEAFNSATIVATQMDVQDTPLYDTVSIAAGSSLSVTTSSFFTAVGPSASKTYAQTNMQQPRQLTSPEAFAIFGFSFRYSENISILDIYNVVNGFAYEFYMISKCYNRAPIWYYTAGGGIYGFTTATNTTVLNNGEPVRTGMHQVGLTIVIENNTTFYAQLQGNAYTLNANGTGITMQSLLRGLYARAVL